jgi:hypothetical protein
MGTELGPDTLHLNELTRLKAREDYIESCRRESFKTDSNSHSLQHVSAVLAIFRRKKKGEREKYFGSLIATLSVIERNDI